jgi:hypothetical protein
MPAYVQVQVQRDEIGRIYCAKHGRETCSRCQTDFWRSNRAAEEKADNHVPTLEEIAEVFSSLLKYLKLLQVIRPTPGGSIRAVMANLHETGAVLRRHQEEGNDVDGALRQALSWMNAASMEKLLHDLGIVPVPKWRRNPFVNGLSMFLQELNRKTPDDWHKWYYAVRILCWLYVVWLLLCAWDPTTHNAWCNENISSSVRFALGVSLGVSSLEILYALQGRSPYNTWYALLLPVVRFGLEYSLTPLVGCVHRSHFVAVIGWALGGIIMDAFFFPLCLLGEMWMLYQAASLHYSGLYLPVLLWPLQVILWLHHIATFLKEVEKLQ